jgi:hypothetical protein
MRARHLRLVGEDLPVIPPGCWPALDEEVDEDAELRVLAQGTGEHLPHELRLRVLEDPHPREAFYDYRRVADERRVLGVDVGEATAMLVDALVAAGWSEQQGRDAGVLELSREEQA